LQIDKVFYVSPAKKSIHHSFTTGALSSKASRQQTTIHNLEFSLFRKQLHAVVELTRN